MTAHRRHSTWARFKLLRTRPPDLVPDPEAVYFGIGGVPWTAADELIGRLHDRCLKHGNRAFAVGGRFYCAACYRFAEPWESVLRLAYTRGPLPSRSPRSYGLKDEVQKKRRGGRRTRRRRPQGG